MAPKEEDRVTSTLPAHVRLRLPGSDVLVEDSGSSLGGKHLRAPLVGNISVGGGGGGSPDCDLATNCCRRLEQYPTDGQEFPLTLLVEIRRLFGNRRGPSVGNVF